MFENFYNLIYEVLFSDGDAYPLNSIKTDIMVEGTPLYFDGYLCSLIALICTIIVYVCVCLCVYKVIRLFGRLWSRL